MPRGVYDRSKFKKAAKSEGAIEAKPKGKRGPKAKQVQAPSVGLIGQKTDGSRMVGQGLSHADIFSIRESLATLSGTRREAAGNTSLVTKIDALIGKTVDLFETALFPPAAKVEVAATEEVAVKTNGSVVPAPITQAPVAFNPPIFAPQS